MAVVTTPTKKTGTGGFPAPVTGGTLADGTTVEEVFDAVQEALAHAGYHKAWVDGWLRDEDGAVVTAGYVYRQVRVKRYLPGQRNGPPQAKLDIVRNENLDDLPDFVGTYSELWKEQTEAGRWKA